MRYSIQALVIFLSLSSFAFSLGRPDPYDGRHRCVLTAEFVYLKRVNKINSQCLSRVDDYVPVYYSGGYDYPGLQLPSSCAPNKCMFTTRDLLQDQGFTPGLAVSLDFLKDKKSTIQARYLGLFEWTGERSATCKDSLFFPFHDGVNNTDDFQDANYMKGINTSKFWSVEGNGWFHITQRRVLPFSVSWLFGLRYLDFKEAFTLRSTTDWGTSHYNINVKNRMGAIQLGSAFEGTLGNNFTWGIVAKGGFVVNFAKNQTLFRDDNDTYTIKQYNPSDFNVAFLGELEPFFYFNLFKNVIFRFSYEGILLSNVAVAMNQISYEEQRSSVEENVDTGGPLIMHGLFIGFSFVF